jgi:ferric-dicitrate binding protein FerR (iron transport regulator)
MKMPPAIDSAMWEVVESGDQALMDEFAARYPEHKGELAKRLTMVRDLKGSKPRAEVKPAFHPRANVEMPRSAARWTTSTVALAVVGTVLATFGLVRIVDQVQARNNPPATEPSSTPYTPPKMQMYQPPEGQIPENDPGPEQTAPSGSQEPPKVDPAQLDPFQRRVTIAIEDAPLSSVLQDIATQANLVLEAAPGMPDVRIHAQYVNAPAMQVLEELGRAFGFTPLKQSRRSALLIPARDRTTPTSGLPTDGSQDSTSTTGGNPLHGPVNSRAPQDEVLPPVGE